VNLFELGRMPAEVIIGKEGTACMNTLAAVSRYPRK